MASSRGSIGRLVGSVRNTTGGESVPLDVVLNDTSGTPVSVGGGVQYTEGDIDTTITGTALLFEGDSTTSTLQVVSAQTPLPVNVVAGSAAGSTVVTANQGGTWRAFSGQKASATLANVSAASTANVTLQASNANREGWTVFNDALGNLHVKFGATASTTSYTVKIAPSGFYEMGRPIYTGIIDGMWDSTGGAARVTEV